MRSKVIPRKLLAFCAAAAVLSACGIFARPEPDAPAPKFSLPALGGGNLSLQSQSGKVVLVHFWASWCPECVHELGTLHNLYRRLNSANFEIIAIAIDDTWPAIKAVQSSGHLSFPILLDDTGAVRKAYGVSDVPQSYLVNAEGALMLFPEPETGKEVLKTKGPQRWDLPQTAEYFLSLLQ